MKYFTKSKIILVILVGVASVVGDTLIRFGLQLMPVTFSGRMSPDWMYFLLNFHWMLLDLVAGLITGIIFVPVFYRRLLAAFSENKPWLNQAVIIGGLAGILNSIILAIIHLSLMAGPGIEWKDQAGLSGAIGLFEVYLPIVVIATAIPASIIGALAGIGGGLLLKKFS